MAYVEMLYADAIIHENTHTLNLLKTNKYDKPSGVQITGNNPEEFKKIILHVKHFDVVDINCGCPSLRIVGNQAGSFLLNNPKKIEKMISILKDANLTVTAKMRLGFNTNNALKIAKIIEKAGADALTVHGRLASQSNKIPADWKEIARIKKNIGIPVIGNGDIDSGKKAEQMLEIADGAMIARAAIGDPLLFKRITNYLKTGKEQEPNPMENLKQFQKYLLLSEKYKTTDLGRIKYLGSNFIKGFSGASQRRNEFMHLKTLEEMQEFTKIITKY